MERKLTSQCSLSRVDLLQLSARVALLVQLEAAPPRRHLETFLFQDIRTACWQCSPPPIH